MKKDVIDSAYGFLKYEVPLKFDCGKMCKRRCCTEKDKGMMLFPGEEKLFNDNEDFKIITDINKRKILFCNGKCNRQKRPLSCRMYPLFTYTYLEENIVKQKVIYDLRGTNRCGIIDMNLKIRKKFFYAVKKAGKVLTRDKESLKMLLEISEEIDDIIKLKGLLEENK